MVQSGDPGLARTDAPLTFDLLLLLVRRGPALSGEHEKVFHRSLDLLLIWVTDYRTVDFTPKPELVCTLENFLNTEVTTAAVPGALAQLEGS